MIKAIDPAAAKSILGLGTSQFWRVIYDNNVPYQRYSSRCIRFDEPVILDLKRRMTVNGGRR